MCEYVTNSQRSSKTCFLVSPAGNKLASIDKSKFFCFPNQSFSSLLEDKSHLSSILLPTDPASLPVSQSSPSGENSAANACVLM